MRKFQALAVTWAILISKTAAHSDHGGYSVSAAAEESKLAYIVVATSLLIALTSLYFIFTITSSQWREKT